MGKSGWYGMGWGGEAPNEEACALLLTCLPHRRLRPEPRHRPAHCADVRIGCAFMASFGGGGDTVLALARGQQGSHSMLASKFSCHTPDPDATIPSTALLTPRAPIQGLDYTTDALLLDHYISVKPPAPPEEPGQLTPGGECPR